MEVGYKHGRSRSRDRDFDRNYSENGRATRRSRSRDKNDHSERGRPIHRDRSPPHQKSRTERDTYKESSRHGETYRDHANSDRSGSTRDSSYSHSQSHKDRDSHRSGESRHHSTSDRSKNHPRSSTTDSGWERSSHHSASGHERSSSTTNKQQRDHDDSQGKKMRFEEAVTRPSTAVGPTVSTLHTKTVDSSYKSHDRDRERDSRDKNNNKNNTKENNRDGSNISHGGNLTPSGETASNTAANTSADIVYGESELKDIESFLEFGGLVEEDEAAKVERQQAERRKRLEDIANKYKKSAAAPASTQPLAMDAPINVSVAAAPAQPILQRQLTSVEEPLEILTSDASLLVSTTVSAATTVSPPSSESSPRDISTTSSTHPTPKRKLSLERNTIPMDISFSAQATPVAHKKIAVSSDSLYDEVDEGHSNLNILDKEDSNDSFKHIEAHSNRLENLALDDLVQQELLQARLLGKSDGLDSTTEGEPLRGDGSVVSGLSSNFDHQDEEGRQLATERNAIELEAKANKSSNYFAFDIFSSSPSDLELLKNGGGGGGKVAQRESLMEGNYNPGEFGAAGRVPGVTVDEGQNHHLQGNWDDGEGYYKARIGEVIGDRYHTLGVVGKGVFSTVLKCVDLRSGDPKSNTVAIKMIRNNDTMRKAAEKERSILLAIIEKDPDNKRFCVRLLTHLDYRSHVALVFEYQQMNLREALKKFGKDVGINIGAVRMYGKQLMIALRLLMELRVVHADIKLDNILCSGDLKQVKLCDFGSAFRETDSDNDPTPYLVSRFYRGPEIILGMPYDRSIDLWSVCVCLYELFTGHVMFPGRTNNEMLRMMMAVKGRFPNKLIKAHIRQYEVMSLEPHFDNDCRFRQYDTDSLTGKVVLRLVDVNQPTRDLATVMRGSKAGADDLKLVAQLTDLLEKGLQLDPSKRLTVSDALKHPFFAPK